MANDEYNRTRLGTMLVDSGRITQSQLKDALALVDALSIRLGEALDRMGLLTKHQVEAMLARQDDARAKSPREKMAAASRAIDAATAATEEHTKTLAEGAESARKITINTELDPIDASHNIGGK